MELAYTFLAIAAIAFVCLLISMYSDYRKARLQN